MNANGECCFSKTALAAYLDRSIRWVDYLLTSQNPPPGYKIGKSWVFKKSEIDLWLENFRVHTDAFVQRHSVNVLSNDEAM